MTASDSDILRDVESVRRHAELVHSEASVDAAWDRVATAVTERFADRNPVILAVMVGGLLPTAQLVSRLRFPFQLDYIHASRYRGDTTGRKLKWLAEPSLPLEERSVLLVDDILDEGVTLSALMDECRRRGAREVASAVLVEKRHDRRQAGVAADFVGLEVDDRYVFGCGMDYRHYMRNLPAVYAVADNREENSEEP